MRTSSVLLALSAVSSAVAAPATKRANYDPLPGGDIDILNYALTLEYLEREFYHEGLANYTANDFRNAGFSADFYDNLKTIAADEKSHVSFLATALGPTAVKEAKYNFPSTDAASFAALAVILEGVGVSAYLGAAAVIADKSYVPIAGSILAVEARHAAYVRSALPPGPKPFLKAYDTPLDFNQVFSLAAQFITGFAAGDPALPFKACPALSVAASKERVTVDGKISVTFKGVRKNAVFFSGLDTYYAKVAVDGDDYKLYAIPGASFTSGGKLPPSGQTYVVLSTADETNKVSDENTVSGVGILEFEAKWENPFHGSLSKRGKYAHDWHGATALYNYNE